MLEPPNIPSRRPAKQNAIQILTGSSPAVHLASPAREQLCSGAAGGTPCLKVEREFVKREGMRGGLRSKRTRAPAASSRQNRPWG